MRTFRKRVFVSYFVLLVLFLASMFPFVTNSVQHIVFRTMSDRADAIIEKLSSASNDKELVNILKEQKNLSFYRIGVLDNERRLLYDSHTKRLLGPVYFPLQFVTHAEIEEALEYGIGYSEEFSHLLGQKLIYVAKRFDFHGKPYVLRLAFPFQYIQELREDFTLGFLVLCSIVLILFSTITALVLNHLSSPIRQIIDAIRGFSEGAVESLPPIRINAPLQEDFTHLANTINSLSQRLQREIKSVTKERNDRDAILEELSDGVMVIDSNNVISYANKRSLEFLGMGNHHIGTPFPEYSFPDCAELINKCRSQQTLKNDRLELGAGQSKKFLHIVALPRVHQEGVILVIQDISLQEQVLDLQRTFIANASHELKTPVTIILGFAEMLKENMKGEPRLSQELIDQVVEKIFSNCSRMTKIIKNLLTLSNTQNPTSFRVYPSDVQKVLVRAIESTSAMYPDATISLKKEDVVQDLFVEMDEELMEVAFSNLLDNGAKYSNGPASIDVTVKKEEDAVVISFKDHGIGIPEADIKNIFQRFYRINRQNMKKRPGAGLGLSIVETIISKHLGTVDVLSQLHLGSTFVVTLPYHLTSLLANKTPGVIQQRKFRSSLGGM